MGGGEPPSSHDSDEVVLVQLIGTFELNSAALLSVIFT
jgi:hypothetical protein